MKPAILTLFLLTLTACEPPRKPCTPTEASTVSPGGVVTLYSNTGEVLHEWTGVERVWATESGIRFTLTGDNSYYLIGGTYSVTPAP